MDFIIISFFVLLFFYHITEYAIHKHFHPKSTDVDSFLITKGYLCALAFGVVEYLLENWKHSEFKHDPSNPMIYIGVVFIAVGLFFRFSAMIHAGVSFSHRIAEYKKTEHKLVTDGVYKYVRHPSYLGYYLFAIGTQIYLSNIVSPILFAVVLWLFFNDRIPYEENLLIEFFGNDYIVYREKTRTWLPFIE